MSNKLARKNYARIADILELPKLIEVQLNSFEVFRREGLGELFQEISPIVSFNKNLELHLLDYRFEEPKYSQEECLERDTQLRGVRFLRLQVVEQSQEIAFAIARHVIGRFDLLQILGERFMELFQDEYFVAAIQSSLVPGRDRQCDEDADHDQNDLADGIAPVRSGDHSDQTHEDLPPSRNEDHSTIPRPEASTA